MTDGERILLHVCCGPCAIYPLQRLRELGFTVTGYFCNHNIHPYKEYQRRLETAQQFAADEKLELVVGGSYSLDEFLKNVADDSDNRCEYCYSSRMKATVKYAHENGFRSYTTSLLVSPYQKHDLIVDRAIAAAKCSDTEFFYEDFRSGWRASIEKCHARGYFRQAYCGCIYSERDRYLKK